MSRSTSLLNALNFQVVHVKQRGFGQKSERHPKIEDGHIPKERITTHTPAHHPHPNLPYRYVTRPQFSIAPMANSGIATMSSLGRG
jgi:hypothetical protein